MHPVTHNLTADNVEWRYRYDERLALLCPDGEPTHVDRATAFAEANQWREGEIERRRPVTRAKTGGLFEGMREAVG